MLVHEVLSRNMRDRRAIARYAGLTGSPDEEWQKTPEKGLACSGNGRVRRGPIQSAWRFLMHQKNSALAQWLLGRHENARGTRKPMIVVWPQDADRPVAASCRRACQTASFCVRPNERRTLKEPRQFRPRPYACDDSLGHAATLRFLSPLIEPDRQISRIRLSDKTSRLCFRVRRLLQFLNTHRSL